MCAPINAHRKDHLSFPWTSVILVIFHSLPLGYACGPQCARYSDIDEPPSLSGLPPLQKPSSAVVSLLTSNVERLLQLFFRGQWLPLRPIYWTELISMICSIPYSRSSHTSPVVPYITLAVIVPVRSAVYFFHSVLK